MKQIYPPLLAAGFQEIGPWQLDQQFLEPFGENERRLHLINRLRVYLNDLINLGIPLEIWLDGSFVTRKPEPDDVDMVVWVQASDIDQLPAAHKLKFRLLLMDRDRVRSLYDVDVYWAIPTSDHEREKWQCMFGFDQSPVPKPKGIFKLTLNHA
ncbi:DUF6932 family protein [Spirosoma montaniterrae]|uniref:Polymerase nucleotidyl transferase domain-containing protein n=1 Tax=Spirosoma montaniterrae TaxID=1178516 RepID=A0A1P9X2H7_9BACT|nr:hypothetical protein [Spirosoma montaniterrae]AQG81837.1 hypothetical protein AWR27_22545 [Spirosoma montaniterrae]